ncbi:S1C family serine protease [Nocardioides antri]|uniref:PDZ domain-containing protein n=1 Tax=Nocardioides antri TaxID=2607659 RepID=A0A5B1M327_9ACTN|nr:trypsin-like peptidase domain-containing protein [Nocardioides antri]KAA1427322.1 PDZ domain-containing protein [Nocardioides antri]
MTISAPPPYRQLPPPVAPPPYQGVPRPRRGFTATVLAGALVVGGGAGLGGAALWSVLDDDGADGAGTPTTAPLRVADQGAGTADRDAPDGSVEEVAATVLPSVVALDVEGGGSGGSGSGVVLTEDGLILTNDHVVSLGGTTDAESAEVTVSFADGSTATGDVVGTDPLTDTALVQAEDVSGLTPITLGSSDDLDVGEQVVAVGSPYGLDSTVTSGIVSALDRPVEVARDEQGNATAYPAIQTDAAINPGNSGGALVDMDGHLVGINASIRTTGSVQGEAGSIGLGFAIPIDAVTPIVEQLRAGEPATHARLGIEVGTEDGGAVIRTIEDGSAAADAGLRAGDVITRIDDHVVEDSTALVATVRSYRPGDEVTITYLRDGEQQTTTMELGSDAD